MLDRLEAERRRAPSAALEAQERERARVARDLHDEVNQALTGARCCGLEATADEGAARARRGARRDARGRGAGDGGAADARPPAAADRARRPRPEGGRSPASSRRSSRQTGIADRFEAEGDRSTSSPTSSSSSPTGSPRRRSRTRSSHAGAEHIRVRARPRRRRRSSCASPTTAPASTRARRRRARDRRDARAGAARGRRPRIESAPGEGHRCLAQGADETAVDELPRHGR